jgi:hypothetical protein
MTTPATANDSDQDDYTMGEPLALRVVCYAGYRGAQEPLRFWLGERKVGVLEILDRWLAPDHRYFKLRGDDGGVYIIRHDELTERWELTLFEQPSRKHPV